ncbi:hypothetical protein OEZ86_009418 [Tetradesmus obliquus]|nr:hypothetical protein OEZ86_009418 [Tetradesmus obliquus]
MTGWDDERLEAKYQELVSGGEDSAKHDDQGQQLEQDASSDADSELCSETAEEEDADAEDEQQQQQQQGRRLRRLQQTGSRRAAEHAEQQQQRADDAAVLQELNEVVADACGGMREAVTAVLTGAQADGCLAEITKGQVRTAVEERTGWNLDRETGSAPLRKLFSEVLEELHTQFWSQDQQQQVQHQEQQQEEQQQQEQEAAANRAAAGPRRQQRKAAACAKQAVLAVLGNSQSLSAAAATDKAVKASQRAALPVEVPAPATGAQKKMVQQLPCDGLGINVEGMLHQLEAALGRSKAASGSANGIQAVEDDLDYAERLLGVCKPPPGRLVAALAKARTALNTQKIGLQ